MNVQLNAILLTTVADRIQWKVIYVRCASLKIYQHNSKKNPPIEKKIFICTFLYVRAVRTFLRRIMIYWSRNS